MVKLANVGVGFIREAIEAYRDAWRNYCQHPVRGATPGWGNPDDSVADWREHELSKRVARTRDRVIEVLIAYRDQVDSVRHRGIVYSLEPAKENS